MKKLLYIVITLALMLSVGCQADTPNGSSTGDSSENSSENSGVKVSTIDYCYWDSIDGSVKDIPDFMWMPQGYYPDEYTENKEHTIDHLRNYRKNSDIIYAFEGWYYDVDYTYKLNTNTIDSSIAPIEIATGKKAYFVGKPNPLMLRHGLKALDCHSGDVVFIGDRMDTDIIAGIESNIDTILVLSGVTKESDLSNFPYQPKYILNGVGDILK